MNRSTILERSVAERAHRFSALGDPARLAILTTPALVIDGKLVLAGQVATVPQLEEMFTGHP